MIKIKAFKAIRPTRDKAHLVASRAVAAYKPSVLEAKLDSNPYTFIHIIHPEFFENDETRTEPNTKERFLKVKDKYKEFDERGYFIKDEEDAIYIYKQSSNEHEYLGVIAGASVQDYKDNKIKKHEATLAPRESMFTNYLNIVGMNAEPVLLCHEKNVELDTILSNITKNRPEYEFTTTDELTHELWVASPEEVKAIQAAYEKIDACYIADGHHRSASSVRLHDLKTQNDDYNTERNYNYFLSFFIDYERLNILPFHRIAKTLNGHSLESLITQFEDKFEVEELNIPSYPNQLHDIHVYVENRWFKLRLKKEVDISQSVVSSIDAEILTKHILSPILNIHDLTTDENINFIGGENKMEELKQSVDSGVYKIGFLLYPVTVDQLKAVSDDNAIMPPKSTWIEPKMRSGLTIYDIDE